MFWYTNTITGISVEGMSDSTVDVISVAEDCPQTFFIYVCATILLSTSVLMVRPVLNEAKPYIMGNGGNKKFWKKENTRVWTYMVRLGIDHTPFDFFAFGASLFPPDNDMPLVDSCRCWDPEASVTLIFGTFLGDEPWQVSLMSMAPGTSLETFLKLCRSGVCGSGFFNEHPLPVRDTAGVGIFYRIQISRTYQQTSFRRSTGVAFQILSCSTAYQSTQGRQNDRFFQCITHQLLTDASLTRHASFPHVLFQRNKS